MCGKIKSGIAAFYFRKALSLWLKKLSLTVKTRPSQYYFNLLKTHKAELLNKYGVSRVGIFGSVARGMHNSESDVDVCIEMQQPDMMNFVGVYSDLENLFGRKVDVVRMSKYTNPVLKKRIEREAIYV